MTDHWHIITPEYPPEPGGVSDFSRILAEALVERGIRIEVWCPPAGKLTEVAGITVHPTLGDFGRSALARTDRVLDATPKPRRLLVQWVPHGYGWKAMNLAFCWWIYRRMRRGDTIDLMVHEPFLIFTGKRRHCMMAVVQRIMAAVLLRAAKRTWCTIPMWEALLRPYAPANSEFRRLPVFSCVPAIACEDATIVPEFEFGHFSSFGSSTAKPLRVLLPSLLGAMTGTSILLIGQRSLIFREEFLREHPDFAPRLIATGPLELSEIPRELHRCGTMLQPVAGGISGRNTSLLASIANGIPSITTTGWLTETFWSESEAVSVVDEGDIPAFVQEALRLAQRPEERVRMSRAARLLYERMFDSRLLFDALVRS